VRTDTQHVTGALIGGTFGAVFVLADANTPLGDVAAAVFRIGAVGGLLGLYLGAARTRRHHARRPAGSWADTEGLNLFARRYWLIVAGELALIGIGLGALGALGAPQQANVAWIALIVGLHFIAFRVADVWGNNVLRPAAALVAFGLAGLGLAAASEAGWTSSSAACSQGSFCCRAAATRSAPAFRTTELGPNPTSPTPARPTVSAGGLARGHSSRSCRAHPFGILGPSTRLRTTRDHRTSWQP
jgi:hypothetical protein